MLSGRSRDLVALVSLLCGVSYGTWLWMRASERVGGGWTDGEEQWASVRGEKIRHAVWDEPLPLAGIEGELASHPAISPDGRWLVFAVGERGLNADLYMAELSSGAALDMRPLGILNSPKDELAPAFGDGALYFARTREGGADLDLWRSTYSGGSFGPPEPVASGVNSDADETDPCPLYDGGLLFSSNRMRGEHDDYELYRAMNAPEGAAAAFVVVPLDALNTYYEERDPSLSRDGHSLVFASDRPGGSGGFDLYRSVLEQTGWARPEPLHGLNEVSSERGPLLSRDGFSLWFDRTTEDGAPELWRASSRELFHVPGPPISRQEILILTALVMLSVLAWLAKRWAAMNIVYKCFLFSVLLHCLALWLLRDVRPEPVLGPRRAIGYPGDDQVFQVRLSPGRANQRGSQRERTGETQAMSSGRLDGEGALSRLEGPDRAQGGLGSAKPQGGGDLEAVPQAPQASAPGRERGAALLAATGPAPRLTTPLENRETSGERLSGTAPGLAISARAAPARAAETSEAVPGARPSLGVGRTGGASVSEALGAPQPATVSGAERSEALAGLARPAELDAAPDGGRLGTSDLARSASSQPGVELAQPSDAASDASALAAAAPELELPAVHTQTRPSSGDGSGTEPGSGDGSGDGSGSAPARLGSAAVGWAAPGAVAQRDAPLAMAGPEDTAEFGAPSRPKFGFGGTDEGSGSPLAPGVDVRTVIDPEAAERSGAVGTGGPGEGGFGGDKPQRFDALAGLERAAPALPRAEPAAGAGPPRLGDAPAEEAPKPLARPIAPVALALPPVPEPAVAEDRPERNEESPYKNRFGNEKLRALEEFGGGKETERAVEAGLAYLASAQNERGFWGSRRDYHDKYADVRIGKTALALLAFLGAGHTPRSGAEYAAVSERAVDFLLSQLDPESGHFGDSCAYGHGIATYALAECYALTKDPVLDRPLRAALQHILENQNAREDPRFFGGWGYYYNDGRVWENDRWPRVSVTSWQVMALESARLGGIEVPEAAFEGARRFLLEAWDDRREAFRYNHDPTRLRSGYPILPASTPAALFALSLLGEDADDASFAAARRFVLARLPQEYRFTSEDAFVFEGRGNEYFWYYGTLAMFRAGGGSWRRWNTAMKETLLPAQAADGSWDTISIYAKYAGDDEGAGGDRAYSTAMSVLTLEVYYRYFTPLLAER